MGWQPNQSGLLLYGSGQGPVTGQVSPQHEMAAAAQPAMTPEGPTSPTDAGDLSMMKLSRAEQNLSPSRRRGILAGKVAADALAEIDLQRAARRSAKSVEDEDGDGGPQQPEAAVGFSSLNSKVGMKIQRGYSETKPTNKTNPPRWEEGHQFQGSRQKKVKSSNHAMQHMLSSKNTVGHGSARNLGKAAGQSKTSRSARTGSPGIGTEQTTKKSTMNRSAAGESGLTAKEKPWSLQGSDAWPSQDEMWSSAKRWDSSLPPGKKAPMKVARDVKPLTLADLGIDQKAITQGLGTGVGAGAGGLLGGAAGLGAALGAGVGGISGLVDPGEDAEGRERSRLWQMLKRMGIGGFGGAVGGAGLAALPVLGGAAGATGGGLLGNHLSKQSRVICTKENCDECGASMEAGDNRTCNRCGAKNSYGQKEAASTGLITFNDLKPHTPLSKTAEGFLNRCVERGMDEFQIAHAVKQACELSPAIAADLEPLVKQANPFLKLLQGGVKAMGGAGARGAARGAAGGAGAAAKLRTLPNGMRLPSGPRPPSPPRWSPQAIRGGTRPAAGIPKPTVSNLGQAVGSGAPRTGASTQGLWSQAWLPKSPVTPTGTASAGAGLWGQAAQKARQAGQWAAKSQHPVADMMRASATWGGGGAAAGAGLDLIQQQNPFAEGSNMRSFGASGLLAGPMYRGGRMGASRVMGGRLTPGSNAAQFFGSKPVQTGINIGGGAAAYAGADNILERVLPPSGASQIRMFEQKTGIPVSEVVKFHEDGSMTMHPEIAAAGADQTIREMTNGQYGARDFINPETGELEPPAEIQQGIANKQFEAILGDSPESMQAAQERGWIDQNGNANVEAVKQDVQKMLQQGSQFEGFMEGPIGQLLGGFMNMSGPQQMLMIGAVLMSLMGLGSMMGGGGGLGTGLLMGGLAAGGLGLLGPQMGLFGGGQQGQPGPGGGAAPETIELPIGRAARPYIGPVAGGVVDPGEIDYS